MSRYNKVVWSEGMFLQPQHFQQQARYIENYVEGRCSGLRPYSWGFTELELDSKLLGLGKIAISKASGVFPDGTPFNIPEEDDPPLAIELPENFREESIFICLPLRRSGTAETEASAEKDSLARNAPGEIEVRDSSTVGGGDSSVQVSKLRLRLMLESEHRDEYAYLGVVRVIECRNDRSILLDDAFIAPLLNSQVSAPLKAFLTELHSLLNHRAEALAGRISVSGRGGAAEISDFLLLQAVNRYLPLIEHLSALPYLHPESLYELLISVTGEMATFTSSDKRAPQLPPYDHQDLKASFKPVFEALRQSLSMVLEQTAISIPMQERKYGIKVAALSDKGLVDHANFVLAVAADLPTEEVRKRLPAQIKIGPVEQIRQLVNVQLPGIKLRPLPVAPRQIPYHTGFCYFELDRSSELWQQLKSSGGFAFHIAAEFPGIQMELWAIKG